MRLDHSLRPLLPALILLLAIPGLAAAQNQQRNDYLPPWVQDDKNKTAPANTPRKLSPAPSTQQSGSGATAGAAQTVPPDSNPSYGRSYEPPRENYAARRHERYDDYERYDGPAPHHDSYSSNEILDAGHRFFGTVSKGLASVIEHAFRRQGRPNGYILGEEAGGAIIAGLRYGEGTLYTKGMGTHRVYWQGPSVGYDFGAEGSKTMILVYNLNHPAEIYERFAGVDGSAYFVGGAGITFQKHNDVILAPIRSGVGLRLGANVGYLKYTPYPTWNPF